MFLRNLDTCFQILPRPGQDKPCCLVIKDLYNNSDEGTKKSQTKSSESLTMKTLRDQNLPFSMLDETVVAPQNTLPEPRDSDGRSISRDVFLIQATFIPGGLILTLVGHHGSMDMVGQGQVIRWFSQACRNEPFSEEDIRIGNMSRPNLIPRFTSDEENQELDRLETILSNQIVRPSTPHSPTDSPPSTPAEEVYWAYIQFPPASLETIKGRARDDLLEQHGKEQFVSTDDALTAFLWRSITRCRQQRLGDNFQTTLGRAVDVRRYFDNIPEISRYDAEYDLSHPPFGTRVVVTRITRSYCSRASTGCGSQYFQSELQYTCPGDVHGEARGRIDDILFCPDQSKLGSYDQLVD